MRGVYQAPIKITGLNAAKTLLYITAPAAVGVEILATSIMDEGTNVTNQQLEATWQRITTLGTPTGTTITPSKAEAGDQAAASTVVGNVTASEPTYTANTDWHHRGFATLAGYEDVPIPEGRFYIGAGLSAGLRMLSTPTAFDCSVLVTFREIG